MVWQLDVAAKCLKPNSAASLQLHTTLEIVYCSTAKGFPTRKITNSQVQLKNPRNLMGSGINTCKSDHPAG